MCNIGPVDVEDGLNYSANKRLYIEFELNGLMYQVMLV